MLNITHIKKIFQNPIKARIFYDLFISTFSLFSLLISFELFGLPHPAAKFIVPFPIIYVFANYFLGIYGKFKTSSTLLKSCLLALSAFTTLLIISFIFGEIAPIFVIGTIFIVLLSILPRFFFNFNTPNSRFYFENLINEKLPVLIVGGAGYIGMHVVEKLLSKGYKVKVFDKFSYGKEHMINLVNNNNLEIIEGDVSDLFKLTLALKNTQSIIHLAGLVGDPACAIDEKLTRHINIITTRMLKESAKAFKIPRFVFASSCSAYGSTEEIVNENSLLNPVSLYAKTKIDAEVELLGDPYDHFNPTILRFSTIYGHSPRMRFDLVANLFVAQAYNDGLITVIGENQCRPFIHVNDVATAIVKVIEAPVSKVSRKIFNVGDNEQNITIGELANLVQTIVKNDRNNRPVRIEVKGNLTDKRNYHVLFDKFRNVLGFKTNISLEQGLKEIYSNLKENKYSNNYKDPVYSNFEMAKGLKEEFYSKDYQKNHYSVMQ